MRLASSSHPCSNRLNGNGSARCSLYEERSAVHVTATMLPVTIPTIFFLIVANSDSIVTTADKQAACIRIIRRMRCFLLSGK